ncbi:hypothetical protein EZV62_001179 [Acer yangbiense]|uniref:Uncharacterized protein n=1 Tax=Acer yangbiense TaxID=1000413 RepID=A0A5C7ITD0_9ROSI|nr:hypothetical protein EZV62_001179 [Acer yangbiense]
MKAPVSKMGKTRLNSQRYGSSSDRSRSLRGSRDTAGDGSVSIRPASLTSRKEASASTPAAAKVQMKETQKETLITKSGIGPPMADEMCVDGPSFGQIGPSKVVAQSVSESKMSSPIKIDALEVSEPNPHKTEAQLSLVCKPISNFIQVLPVKPEIPYAAQSPKKKTTKKWKRAAREGHHQQIPGIVSSPLHILLGVKQLLQKSSKAKTSSPTSVKSPSPSKSGRNPTKLQSHSFPSLSNQCNSSLEIQTCKRKVVFDNQKDEIRFLKKGKLATSRKKKNAISSLLDSEGCMQDMEAGLSQVISEFFTALFNSSNPLPQDIRKATGPIKSRISDEMRTPIPFLSLHRTDQSPPPLLLLPRTSPAQLRRFFFFDFKASTLLCLCKSFVVRRASAPRRSPFSPRMVTPTKTEKALKSCLGFIFH